MERTDPQFKLRMPAELKSRLEESARSYNRSLTAEIVARLEASLAGEDWTRRNDFLVRVAAIEARRGQALESLALLRRDGSELQAKVEKAIAQEADAGTVDELRRLLAENRSRQYALDHELAMLSRDQASLYARISVGEPSGAPEGD